MAEFTEQIGCGRDGFAASAEQIAQFAARLDEVIRLCVARQASRLLKMKAAQVRRGPIKTPRLALGHA